MQKKLIAVGLGSLSYGVLLGWAFTADYFDEKMKRNQKILIRVIDRQAEKLATAEKLLLNDPVEKETEKAEEETEEVVVTTGEPQPEHDEEVDEEGIEEARSNLQRIIDSYTKDEDSVHNFTEQATLSFVKDTPPFVIPQQKYAWDEEEGDEYEKITLTYYPRDRILLDDEEDVIDDVNKYVGWKNLNRFGDESGDADVVFIRNRWLKTDFEVVRETDAKPPAHVRYGMGRHEFETNKAAGLIKFRPEDT